MTMATQQALKDRIVAALVTNGWGAIFEQWWRSYNRAGLDAEVAGHAVRAYLVRLADDIAEALVEWDADCVEFGCHEDGTQPL